MKAVLAFIVLTLVGPTYCVVKRQCNCFNTRQFAANACPGITEFESLFTVSGSTIPPFGSVLDRIDGRTDSRSVINEICTSQSCFSRLSTMYSCCMVSSSGDNGLITNFDDVARNFACNRPSLTLDYCANSIDVVTTIMADCNNVCNDRCAATLRRSRSCCVISYFELLTNATQQRILREDIWSSCGVTAPSKCSNSLCFLPTFTEFGQDAIVDNGGVHTVTCRADGEEPLQYELLKGENEELGFQLLGTFNFENMNGNDGGRYRCVASNECNVTRSDPFTIYVRPRIAITSFSNTTLIDTEQIDLQCIGDGYPEPSVQWVFDGTMIKIGGQLLISNLTINDSGVYYCMGSSSVGSANESISITVYPAPTPTSSVVSVTSTTMTVMTSSIVVEFSTSTTTIVQATFLPTDAPEDDDELTVILAIVIPLVIVIILIFIIILLLCDVYRRKKKAPPKHKIEDKKPLLRSDPLSMVTLREEPGTKTPDAENPLASPDPFGLVGISEAVEQEEGSTHDSVDAKSDELKDSEAQEPQQQDKVETESQVGETKDQEASNKQEANKTKDEEDTTEMKDEETAPGKPERWIERSGSVAQKTKMFERKLSSPTSPPNSPRKPKITLPTAEPTVSSQIQEGQSIDLQATQPPLPVEPPPPLLEQPAPPPPAELPPPLLEQPAPPPPAELPPQLLEQPAPPPPSELPPQLLEQSAPPPPAELPPQLLEEPVPPPPAELPPQPLEQPPPPPPEDLLPPTPPESPPPPPPTSEPPPLLEISQTITPPTDQADGDIQLRSTTMPAMASEKKKLMKKVAEKKRAATVVKVTVKSNPLTPNALEQLVQNAADAAAAEGNDDNKIENLLAKEFHSIPMNFPRQEDLPKGCAVKDRYANVKPNAHSRVMLQSTGDELSTYINANYIRGLDGKTPGYIASQGPTEASMGDFWRMVWEQEVSIVIMLTGLVENGKLKCNRYWPEYYGEDNVQYGSMVVINTSEKKGRGFYITRLTIYQADDPLQQREVTHFWFTAWPDFGVPETTSAILALHKHVHEKRGTKTAPIMVHCSAGVGRTGVFCAVDMGIQQYDSDGMVNPLQYLSQMRQDRGGMIQKTKQYEFVCQVLLDYIQSKKG